MDHTVQELIDRGLSSRSRSTYRTGINRYLRFCLHFSLPPLPLSQVNLCRFAAFLHTQDLSPSAIRVYLSGVRFYQIQTGGPDPSHADMPQCPLSYPAGKASRPPKTPPTNYTCHPTPPPLCVGGPAGHLHFTHALGSMLLGIFRLYALR